MNYEQKYKEVYDMRKEDLLYLIENLMEDGKIDITDINLCHTNALKRKLQEKDKVIHEADCCIFESVFTDSIGKPAGNAALQRKLEWLDKVGAHNMKGIMEFIKCQNQ